MMENAKITTGIDHFRTRLDDAYQAIDSASAQLTAVDQAIVAARESLSTVLEQVAAGRKQLHAVEEQVEGQLALIERLTEQMAQLRTAVDSQNGQIDGSTRMLQRAVSHLSAEDGLQKAPLAVSIIFRQSARLVASVYSPEDLRRLIEDPGAEQDLSTLREGWANWLGELHAYLAEALPLARHLVQNDGGRLSARYNAALSALQTLGAELEPITGDEPPGGSASPTGTTAPAADVTPSAQPELMTDPPAQAELTTDPPAQPELTTDPPAQPELTTDPPAVNQASRRPETDRTWFEMMFGWFWRR